MFLVVGAFFCQEYDSIRIAYCARQGRLWPWGIFHARSGIICSVTCTILVYIHQGWCRTSPEHLISILPYDEYIFHHLCILKFWYNLSPLPTSLLMIIVCFRSPDKTSLLFLPCFGTNRLQACDSVLFLYHPQRDRRATPRGWKIQVNRLKCILHEERIVWKPISQGKVHLVSG